MQLALVGSMATDDPEGWEFFNSTMAYADGDPDIHILNNLNNVGAIEVNAFQSQADVVIQKSTREGFGLTVSEALWKGRPFIGGDVGGIPLQVQNGETGFLVSSPEECADRATGDPPRAGPRQAARPSGQGARSHALPHAPPATRLAEALSGTQMNQDTPLVLVSNRGPATFEGGEARRGGGGLVTALQGLVHHRDAVWVASAMTDEDAEMAERHGGGSFAVEVDGETYRIRLVDERPGRLRPLLQRGREPDAVVHPALPVGPLERAGHPQARGGGVRGRLLRGERGPRARGARGGRGRGGGGRDAPRLPPLRGAEVHPPGAARPLPPPLRPHPVDAAGRVARAARRHARGHLRGHPVQRHHRLPHALLPAQLPALLPRAVRPGGGRGGGRRALRRARRVGALLPAADLGGDVPARPRSGRRCTSTSARSCAAGAST